MTEPGSTRASGSAIVTKCVENGRISYGYQACAASATAAQLHTHANQNLLDSWKSAKATSNNPVDRQIADAAVIAQTASATGQDSRKTRRCKTALATKNEVAPQAFPDRVQVRPAALALNTLHHCY